MNENAPYLVQNFEEFWPHYVRLHQRRETQLLHALATVASYGFIATGIVRRNLLFVLLAPLLNHVIAQASHRWFEHNRTTPLRNPRYHARAEFRMLLRVLSGQMTAEVARHTKP